MNKAMCFSYFFPICTLWVAYLEKEENNLPCGGNTEKSGDSELSSTFIKAENSMG